MHPRPNVLRTLITAAVIGIAPFASAGIMSYSPMTGDLDSGIDSALQYTAKADFFGTGGTVVNDVSFLDTDFFGTGYSLSGPDASFPGGSSHNVFGDVGGMLNTFFFGPADGNATLTLTDLTIGTEYVTTWYNRGWGDVGGRYTFITASDNPDGFFRIDQNFASDANGSVIRYTFTATATTQTYAFDAVINADSFHHYAFTNAVRNDTVLPITGAPVAPRISTQNGSGPQIVEAVSATDLLRTQLAGASVSGDIDVEGTGGVAALTDGAFTAGAGNEAYFTPRAGASVTFDLDVTTNTLGYDISSVRGYGGWNDNGRDRQNYSLYYSLVGDSEFVFLGTVDFDIDLAAGTTSTITSIFDTALTGVDAIRVDFLEPQENGHAGYGEFDVIGVASVPEPSSFLLLLGAIPLLQRPRRRA